jgi:NTE family protein
MFWDKIARRAVGHGGGGHHGGTTGGNDMLDLTSRSARRSRKPLLGLALGGGAARGWAHVGVLQALMQAGLTPDVIAGTSIGAVVGGCHAAGKLDELQDFAASLTKRRVVGLMDFHLGSGLISGGRLRRLLTQHVSEIRIEDLPVKFAAIATELGTGHEIWLTHGALVEAVRASYALPGVFDPVRLGGRWLMDGALVNPVPVTAARALGADVVVCVNLNGDYSGRGTTIQSHPAEPDIDIVPELEVQPTSRWFGSMRGAARRVTNLVGRSNDQPGLAGVMIDAFNITQDRISRSRLAGDPPDVMISPRLGKVGLFDFHRAEESIALGRVAAERAIDDITQALAASPVAAD